MAFPDATPLKQPVIPDPKGLAWQWACLRIAAIAIFLFAMVPIDPIMSAILVPILPTWIIVELLRFRVPIFDYRIIYLFAHTFWLGTWNSISLISQSIEFPSRIFASYPVYVTAVIFSCLLSIVAPNISCPSRIFEHMQDFRKPVLAAFFGLAALSFIMFALNQVSTDFSLVLLLGPVVVMGAMALLLVPANTPQRIALVATIVIIELVVSVVLATSRTAVLLPIWCCCLALFLRNFYFEKTFSYWIFLILIPVLGLIVIVASGVKFASQIGFNSTFSIFSEVNFFDLLRVGITKQQYLQFNPVAALYYFVGMDNIAAFNNDYFGILFFQLISIFFPRRFFPNKPDSDVVRLMYDRDQIEQNAQYDPFFEKMADAGIPGVLFYSFLPMMINAVLTKASTKSKYPSIRLLGVGVYTLNTAVIFLSTRGPYIVLAWAAIPCLALTFFLWLERVSHPKDIASR